MKAENKRIQQENKDLKFINGKLKLKVDALLAEIEALKASPQPEQPITFPDADTLLNRLGDERKKEKSKAKREKPLPSLADIEAILEMIEE